MEFSNGTMLGRKELVVVAVGVAPGAVDWGSNPVSSPLTVA